MHFFRAREAADAWVSGRNAVSALSLAEAFELAQAQWVRHGAGA